MQAFQLASFSTRVLFKVHAFQRALYSKWPSYQYFFRSFVVLLLAISIVWIPIIQQFHNAQLFVYVQVISAFFQPPIAAVFVLAMLWHRVTEPVSLLSLRFMNIYHIKKLSFFTGSFLGHDCWFYCRIDPFCFRVQLFCSGLWFLRIGYSTRLGHYLGLKLSLFTFWHFSVLFHHDCRRNDFLPN